MKINLSCGHSSIQWTSLWFLVLVFIAELTGEIILYVSTGRHTLKKGLVLSPKENNSEISKFYNFFHRILFSEKLKISVFRWSLLVGG